MTCACGWEGPLAAIQYEEHGWTFTTKPCCFICRVKIRPHIRRQGGRIVRLVPST